MVAIMGPPPKEMLPNSEYAMKFFDLDGTIIHFISSLLHYGGTTDGSNSGNWKGTAEIPSVSLEELEGNLRGTPQSLFLSFMQKMFQWQPENRASAKELLADPWLRST